MADVLPLESPDVRGVGNHPAERFGPYQILGRLGVGGMAEVLLARTIAGPAPPSDGTPELVALKKMLPHLAEDIELVSRFKREASITMRLHHPAIARVLNVGRVGASSFMAIELVAGETLSRALRRERKRGRRMPVDVLRRIGVAVASALDYAHDLVGDDGRPLQIIHRDVSPQNVMLGFDGSVKLIDFGVARWADSGTRTGTRAGKVRYFSPEQVAGRRVDRRTDIFSLGVMLAEALLGHPIFSGDNDMAVMHAILTGEPPHMGDAPPSLTAALQKAMSKAPEARFATARELGEALARADDDRAALPSGLELPDPLVATYMGDLFPERKARWQAVLEQAYHQAPAEDAVPTVVAAGNHPGTLSATVARTAPPAAALSVVPASESPTRPGSPRWMERRLSGEPPSRRPWPRARLASAAVVFALLVVAVGWRSRPRAKPTPVRDEIARVVARPPVVATERVDELGPGPASARFEPPRPAPDREESTRRGEAVRRAPVRRASADGHRRGSRRASPAGPAVRPPSLAIRPTDELEPSPY